ncbi:TPR repeat-containing protein (plasmid) [Rickettsia australis str. Cutlack]|uniref:TPR repeat-containing protein n=1 Tax=Rickettsia australis (strain Cutlack) TaxID=1105110 RepID=H8K9Y6_RICAC|nr:hypothetical protein [Rickettsia australis]AFC71696.1 TPR repeat-containing protein [Rickettsia australis str. Cutlack]
MAIIVELVSAPFVNSHKDLACAASRNASNSCALLQKPHSQKSTKYKAARLVNDSHGHNKQFLSASFTSKIITVLISFLKLDKYDDA